MKNLLLLSICFLLSGISIAQAPGKFNYQAVARDQNGTVITGDLDLKISFLQNGPNGFTSYSETHHATSNQQGVFSLTIGDGSPVSGDMSTIDWSKNNYWVKIELKPNGANNYTEMGTAQLLSVPYAKYAAQSGDKPIAGNGISIANNIITNTGDISDQNELQTLSLNGSQLAISDGNTVTLPIGTSYSEGDGIIINGNFISAIDESATNELQTLSLNGQQLSLSNGGGSVTLPDGGNSAWSTNGTLTNLTPISNNVAIGANNNFNSKLYVSGTGSDHAGSFYAAGSGNGVNGYNNSTGIGVLGSALSGKGGSFTSVSGVGGYFSSSTGPALITENGNVGIGTLTPARRLHVSGSTLLTNPAVGGVALEIGAGKVGIGITSPTYKFEVNGTSYLNNLSGPSLLVDHGNVGIGTLNPTYKLSVIGGSTDGLYVASTTGYGINAYSEGTSAAGFFHAVNGAAGFFYSNNYFCLLAHQGAVGTAANDQGIALQHDGDVWKTYIDVAHDYNFAYGNALRAWILDTDGSFHNSSDRSLKKDITEFTDVLPRLTKLQAYTYRMKNAPDDSPVSVGFMAQEVEAQFPQLVIEKEGYKSLCYDHFAVLSVEAIKEQQVEIDDLKKQVADMKQDKEAMRQELTEMKMMISKLAGK